MSDEPTINQSEVYETLGKLAAYQLAFKVQAEALQFVLASHDKTFAARLRSSVQERTKVIRRDNLHVAPLGSAPDLEAACNQAFQKTLADLCRHMTGKPD